MADPTKVTFIYQNLITNQGILTVSSEASSFGKKYLIDRQYSTTWRSANISGVTSITMDFGQIVTASCFSIGNHNLYSEVTGLRLYYSVDGSVWDEIDSINFIDNITENDFVKFFDPIARRYWKLDIAGGTNITFHEIGELGLSQYVELISNPTLPLPNFENQKHTQSQKTSGGQEHSYKLYEAILWTLNFSSYNVEHNQTILRALWNAVGLDAPFWVWLDPTDIDTLKFVKMESFNFDLGVGVSYPGSLTVKSSL